MVNFHFIYLFFLILDKNYMYMKNFSEPQVIHPYSHIYMSSEMALSHKERHVRVNHK